MSTPSFICSSRRSVLLAAAPLVLTHSATASSGRNIRFICPFPAGGTVDAVMRAMASELGSILGQHVLVDVQSGGNGALAARQLVAAPPDGQTWMMATLGTSLSLLTRPTTVDPLRDMRSVALVARDVSILVVSATSPAHNLEEFLAAARQHPGKFNYLRTGETSLSHLVVACLNKQSGADIEAVDYRGLPPGILDLLADRLSLAVLTAGLALPQIRAGRLRAVAIVGPNRLSDLPDVPTLSEHGYDDANVRSWAIAVVRAGTPEPVRASIGQAFAHVLAQDDIRQRLTAIGVVPADGDGADALFQNTYSRLGHLLAAVGLGSAPSGADAVTPRACAAAEP